MSGRGGKRKKRRKAREGADAAVAPKARVRPRGSWMLLALAAVVVAASVWVFMLYPSERGPGEGRAVEVEIPQGTDAGHLAVILGSAGVVGSPRLFVLWVRLTGGASAVVAGAHLLTDDASPREIMSRLERRSGGGSARVTFPEGWTRFDMARRLQDKHVVSLRAFLDATTDAALLHELGLGGDSAEGFLFPATYELSLDSDPKDVVRRMKREFEHRWDVLSHAHSATLTDVMSSAGFGVRDVVTLASVGSSRVDLQACKLEYSIVSPK